MESSPRTRRSPSSPTRSWPRGAALRLPRDRPGQRPGRRAARRNIRVVFLYNPARVTFVDRGSAATNRSTTGTSVVKSHGGPDLTLSPGRIDPTNPAWSSSRKPLVGEFKFNGKNVFVIANHFDAKLGDQSADGRFQFPAQSSATQRSGQAATEHKLPRADPGDRQASRCDRARRPQRLPIQPGAVGAADRNGRCEWSIDPHRPDQHPAAGPAVHLRVRRRLRGARSHSGQQGRRRPSVPDGARELGVRTRSATTIRRSYESGPSASSRRSAVAVAAWSA